MQLSRKKLKNIFLKKIAFDTSMLGFDILSEQSVAINI